MQGIITLKNPIMIDGKPVTDIKYDTNEITTALYAEAESRKRTAEGIKNVSFSAAVEFDFALHPFIGFAAAIAVNPGYDFADLERVRGGDIIAFAEVGRNFLLKSEDAPPETSDGQSENTAKPIIRAQPSLSESE